MNKIGLVALLLIASLILIGCGREQAGQQQGIQQPQQISDDGQGEPAVGAEGSIDTEEVVREVDDPVTVEITEDGFSPSTVTISVGNTITFINTRVRNSWPASDVHPAHRAYPGSDISKCSSVERDTIFDACRRLPQGGEYSFRFMESGTWHYHDHLRPREKGVIIVE